MLDQWKMISWFRPSLYYLGGLTFMVSVPEIYYLRLNMSYHEFWDTTVEAPKNK
jgi:hypothetical protein